MRMALIFKRLIMGEQEKRFEISIVNDVRKIIKNKENLVSNF